jgi:hypothetical protein
VLNKKIKSDYLEQAGFEFRQGSYHYKHLLNKFIVIEIEIDLDEKWLVYFVKVKDIDEYYIPFYLSEYRIHNLFYEKVAYRFNQFMDSLCRKNILWRPGFVKKPEPSRRKKYVGDKNYNRSNHNFSFPVNYGLRKSNNHTSNKSRTRTG